MDSADATDDIPVVSAAKLYEPDSPRKDATELMESLEKEDVPDAAGDFRHDRCDRSDYSGSSSHGNGNHGRNNGRFYRHSRGSNYDRRKYSNYYNNGGGQRQEIVFTPFPTKIINNSNSNNQHNNGSSSDHQNTGQIHQSEVDSLPAPKFLRNNMMTLNSIQLNAGWWSNVDKLVEFRFDILPWVSFIHNDMYSASAVTLAPGHITTVIESVVHYFTQPICLFVNGQWTLATMPTPIAQHVCVSMDDGEKRYEEVISLNSTKYICTPDFHGQAASFCSVGYRVRCGNQQRRPKYRDLLRHSLSGIVQSFSEAPMEVVVSRATGRAILMDKTINKFFLEAREPFETHVQPVLQHIPTTISFKLTGVNFSIVGTFYRPLLSHASILICSGDCQLFECVTLCVSHAERRVFATAHDSAFARKIYKKGGFAGLKIVDSVSYTDFGPDHWGPQLIRINPRVPEMLNPLFNITMNAVFNRTFNPYASSVFIPPTATNLINLTPGTSSVSFLFTPVPDTSSSTSTLGNGDQKAQDDGDSNLSNNSNNNENEVCSSSSNNSKTNTDEEPKPKLNVLAAEFYPTGYFNQQLTLQPQTNIPISNEIPPYSGPEEVLVSLMVTDSEDFDELEDECAANSDTKVVEICSAETQTCFQNIQNIDFEVPNDDSHLYGSGLDHDHEENNDDCHSETEKVQLSNNTSLTNSWSEEVEEHLEEQGFGHQGEIFPAHK